MGRLGRLLNQVLFFFWPEYGAVLDSWCVHVVACWCGSALLELFLVFFLSTGILIFVCVAELQIWFVGLKSIFGNCCFCGFGTLFSWTKVSKFTYWCCLSMKFFWYSLWTSSVFFPLGCSFDFSLTVCKMACSLCIVLVLFLEILGIDLRGVLVDYRLQFKV